MTAKLRRIHVNAVNLGDRLPILNGTVVAIHDTPKTKSFTVRRPDGSYVTRRFMKTTAVMVPWR